MTREDMLARLIAQATDQGGELSFDGLLHRAAPGMLPSAIRRTAGLDDDGAEIEGALTHEAISEADLDLGRFDNATIIVGAVDWETLENVVLYRGRIASVSHEAEGFVAELKSNKSALDLDPLPRTSPTCRARFCDRGCSLSAQRFTRREEITGVDLDANSLTFSGIDAGRFVDGELRLLDGPQAGFRFTVVAQEQGALLLGQALAEGIEPGQPAILREGCDHTIATCAARFGNAANFQGEPFLPGNDLLAQYPMPR